ncbi:MAG: PqqD family protein, partial [Bacteroidaceae bacterium]|nr:PqqD family protein [Bacteroidaceae bacterium]
MISIDEVSYFLWQHLQEYTTIPQLISQAQQEYNDPKGLMELDVREYIFGFLNNNLIIKEK